MGGLAGFKGADQQFLSQGGFLLTFWGQDLWAKAIASSEFFSLNNS